MEETFKKSVSQLLSLADIVCYEGKFHDQGDAKWKVIRGQLRDHDYTPCGRPTPGRPIGQLGVGRIFGGFSNC
jgi:hypothetical protein